jgi:hypothetical protein
MNDERKGKEVNKMQKLGLVVVFALAALASHVYAASYIVALGSSTGLPENGLRGTYKLVGYLDMTQNTYTTSDIVSVIHIPKKVTVLSVMSEVLVPTTGNITIGVGDSAGATTYLSTVSTTNHVTTPIVASAYTTIKSYIATNDIRCTISGAAGAVGMVKITAVCADLN